MTTMIKELFDAIEEQEALAQMEKDFEMMKADGTYEILFPEPTEEDLEAMFQEELASEDEEDFFIPEEEDMEKMRKEMEEIPI